MTSVVSTYSTAAATCKGDNWASDVKDIGEPPDLRIFRINGINPASRLMVLPPVPAEAGAAAAEEQDGNNDDCHGRETDVVGERVANVVAVAVGGALDALLLHIVEAIPDLPRIRQAPSA